MRPNTNSDQVQAVSRPRASHANPYPFRRYWAYIVGYTTFAIILFGGVAGSLLVGNLDRQLQSSVIVTDHLGAAPQSSAEEAPPDRFEGRAVNLLISGIDSRYNDNGKIGAGTIEKDPTIRSDTTMIVHLAANRKSATVLSIPRDMKVNIPSCRLADGTESWEYYGMFNSAFSTGAGLDDVAGGIACTQAAAENLVGVDIDGFVMVDFAGFARLIDALGGVDMCVEEPLYDKAANLDLKAGCQTLDGSQGLAFARARKMLTDGSDIRRIDRQQLLIGLMISQVLDSNLITNMPKLYAFLQEGMATSKLSPSLSSMRTDAALLNSLRNIPKKKIRFLTVPWEVDPDDPNRVIPEYYQAEQIFEAISEDHSLPTGTVFRDLDNQTYVIDQDGKAAMSDEYGVPYELDEDGKPILPEQTGTSTH